MKSLIILLAVFLSAAHAFAQNPVWSKKYHTGSVTCLDFSGDGTKLLSGGKDGQVTLYSTKDGSNQKSYPQKYGEITSIQFSQKGDWFVGSTMSGYSNCIRGKLNEDSLQFVSAVDTWVIKGGHYGYGIGYSERNIKSYLVDDSLLCVLVRGIAIGAESPLDYGGKSGFIDYYSLLANRRKNSEKVNANAAFDIIVGSQDKSKIFLYGDNHVTLSGKHGGNYFYNVVSAFHACGIYDLQSQSFTNLVLSDTKQFAFTPQNYFVQNNSGILYTIPISNTTEQPLVVSTGSPFATALASDLNERFYISTHTDSTIRLWTPGIPNIFKRILLKSPVTTIAVSPDSVHFATAHTDGTVALWNIDSLAYYAVTDSVFTPSIDSISQNQTLCKNENAEFHVSAKSNFGEGLSYQWQKGGVDITESDSVRGVTTATLLLKNIDNSDAGSYTAIVTTAKGEKAISAPMQLTVRDIPVIAEQPIAKAVLPEGQALVLNVVVLDTTNAQFQWFKNGMAIDSATKQQYVFKADFASAGMYSVRITNPCGSIMSDEAEIAILVTDIAEENPFKNTTLTAEPNPFKNLTTIRFSLEKPLKIKLAVTDILGREIAVLKDEVVEMGEQNVVFKNESLPDGTYFITLSGDGLLKTIPVNIAR